MLGWGLWNLHMSLELEALWHVGRHIGDSRLSRHLQLDKIEQLGLEGLLLGQVTLEDGKECFERVECRRDSALDILLTTSKREAGLREARSEMCEKRRPT